jgi:hypothetical protein
MDRNFVDLLSALNSQSTRYFIAGGYAVTYHSELRGTNHLDLFYGTDSENCATIFRAYGAPLAGLSPQDFQSPDQMFRFGRPYQVDSSHDHRRRLRGSGARSHHG